MHARDYAIMPKNDLCRVLSQSADLHVRTIAMAPNLTRQAYTQSNYATRGHLTLFADPVMHLTEYFYRLTIRDYDDLEMRYHDHSHGLYEEVLINSVRALILDAFHIHASIYNHEALVSRQMAVIMQRFIEMLERGDYKRNREINYYADLLFVTPKYLSEVSKKVSGYGANYWINRYAAFELSRLLHGREYSLSEISDMFGFSSQAYFSRYVEHNLGMRPSDFRK